MQSRTQFIVTDLTQEQLQLVSYPNNAIVDQNGHVIAQTSELVNQEARIIDEGGQITETSNKDLSVLTATQHNQTIDPSAAADVVQAVDSLVNISQTPEELSQTTDDVSVVTASLGAV